MTSLIDSRKTAIDAVEEWCDWLMGWSPSVGRMLSEPCTVCAQSDLLENAAGIARLPHGVTHALVSGIEGRLEAAEHEYFRIRMTAIRSELERRLAMHDFESEPDLFEVSFRIELRAELTVRRDSERVAAEDWAAAVREEVQTHLIIALDSVARGLIEILQIKLRQLEWDIPNTLDPAEVLGDVRLTEYLRPAFEREVEEWMTWLSSDRWRSVGAIREGERCPACARSPIASMIGDVPHGAVHALQERLDALEATAFRSFQFAPAELPQSSPRFTREASVRRAMSSLLLRARPTIERAVDVYVLVLVDDEVSRVTANLDIGGAPADGAQHP